MVLCRTVVAVVHYSCQVYGSSSVITATVELINAFVAVKQITCVKNFITQKKIITVI